MRLIDADNLIKQLEKCKNNAIGTYPISIVDSNIQLVNNQPTAYDVDKVVERIYKEQEEEFIANEVPIGCIDCAEVIKIVKEGGVNECTKKM